MGRINSKKLIFNLTSKLFQPLNVLPQTSVQTEKGLSKSHKLMIDLGIIRSSANGIYNILPLGVRSLNKIRNIVRNELFTLNAQEVKLPHLTNSSLWKKSGRLNNEGLGVFMLRDRHNRDMILCPTNEEVITDLISNVPQFSYRHLPLLMYQISTKFRDEIKPRCGLLKAKEFEMKDMYTFDKCMKSAELTYNSVSEAYQSIFETIGIPFIKASADTGDMKGIFSHEYHVKSNLGEDTVISCEDCSHTFNSENNDITECQNCKSKSLIKFKCIEVGHTFLLGTVYSKPLNAIYTTDSNNTEFLVMGCYGLGLTRILAAGIEYLSTDNDIVWPANLAPFNAVIITPKSGSKEYEVGKRLSEDLYNKLNEIPKFHNDVIIDDRENMTIGKRILYAKRTGYPIVLVVGSKATKDPPLFEIIDTRHNIQKFVSFEEMFDLLKNPKNGFSLNEVIA